MLPFLPFKRSKKCTKLAEDCNKALERAQFWQEQCKYATETCKLVPSTAPPPIEDLASGMGRRYENWPSQVCSYRREYCARAFREIEQSNAECDRATRCMRLNLIERGILTTRRFLNQSEYDFLRFL
eukprot:tig00001178_g7385.t1